MECCGKGWIRTANRLWHLQEMMKVCVATKGSIRPENIMRILQEMMNERPKISGVTKRAKRWIGIQALGAFLQRGEVLYIASVDLSHNPLLAEYSSIHMHRTLGLISSLPRFELQTSFLNFCHTLIGPQSFPMLLVSNSRPHSYLNDDKIQDFVERNLCKLLLLLVLIILVLFGSVRSFLKRSLKRRCASIFWRVEIFSGTALFCSVLGGV